MDAVLSPLLIKADILRGFVLSKTLRVSFLRYLFFDRAARLMALYILACAIYLPLSLLFPVWIAILGPIMYGLPHIFSSFRYAHTQAKLSLKTLVIGIWVAVTFFRIALDFGLFYFASPVILDIEFASWLLSFAALWFVVDRRPAPLMIGSALLAVCLYAAWTAPLFMTAFFLLAHNLVAFIYWIFAVKNKRELAVTLIATLTFIALTAGILTGVFEALYSLIRPQGYVALFGIDYSDLGAVLAPWSEDHHVWYRFFVAYVFGQSLHYFIWLKAIPEQHLKSQAPVSFRESYRLLKVDFGRKLLLVASGACALSLGIWLFYSMQEARIIYFAIASFHGFYELAGLPFQRWRLASV